MENQFLPVEQLSYSQAVAELEDIIRRMQSDKIDIDQLTVYTRRASELLKSCRSRLTTTDNELKTILDSLA